MALVLAKAFFKSSKLVIFSKFVDEQVDGPLKIFCSTPT
jgi:hypothetical protein